jgi:hypothetical protein
MMEKDKAIIFFAALFACLANAAWADLTLNNTISSNPLGDIMNRVNGVACIFLTLITYLASGIGAVIILYAGVKYIISQDAEQTTNAKNMILYALIGLALVVLACPIVDYFVIGTKITPFQEKCNCLGSIGKDPDIPPPPALTCDDGTPEGSCSTTSGYAGYKCKLLGSTLTLVLDPSCNGPPGPTSSTTTTTTTTKATTTTTTMADHGICYNAERDGLCSALNVLMPGLEEDCCNEWRCCCATPSGTCTSP